MKVTMIVLLAVLTANSAVAAIYKCQHADGTIFFTDDPSQKSVDCHLEQIKDLPPISILPETSASQIAKPGNSAATSGQTEGEKAKTFGELKDETTLLVNQFTDAHRRAMRGQVVNKLQARSELAAIRTQKNSVVNEIEQSSLTPAEKQELLGMLATITE